MGKTKYAALWIFDILADTRSDVGGEIQLTTALKTLLGRGAVDGYLFEGKRYDAGDKLGFLQATVEFALKRKDLGGPPIKLTFEYPAIAEAQAVVPRLVESFRLCGITIVATERPESELEGELRAGR